MYRISLLLLLVALVPLPSGVKPVVAAEDKPVSPAPRPTKAKTLPGQSKTLPVAPFPHQPGEIDLTNEDLGIVTLPPIERIEDVQVPPPGIDPKNPPGVPVVIDPLGTPLTGAEGLFGMSAFSCRSGVMRANLLVEYGGSQKSEAAVALGLAWLAKQQKVDGSWEFDGGSKNEKAAATGMVLLAFLGAGETHKDSKKYQKTIQSGVNWLLKNVSTNGANAGKFNHIGSAYSQAIAGLALVEAYGMTKDPTLRSAAQAVVNYIQLAQATDGSWGYSFGSLGDTSIVGWQIQVLVTANRIKELKVDEKVFKKASEFLDKTAGGNNKAVYGYVDNKGANAGSTLTAVGLWCREHIDEWTPKTPGLVEGVEDFVKRGTDGTRLNTYLLHYAAPMIRDYGGDEWKTWNEGPLQADGSRKGGMRDVLIGLQVAKEGNNQGSWDSDRGFIGMSCGRVGTTALCVLALEVYYRQMPPKANVKKIEKP